MKIIKVSWCGDCPFMNSDYDDFAVGFSTVDSCNLQEFLNTGSSILSIHDNIGHNNSNINPPEWCPLKLNDFSFHFEPFTKDKQNQVTILKEKIKNIENKEDLNDLDYDNLNSLYEDLNKNLYENR